MSFDFYYWPVPFRGQFIRAILAYRGCEWAEHDADDIAELISRKVGEAPVAFMGPPVLLDRKTGFAVSQMPAIAAYLSERLDLLPNTPEGRALAFKVTTDANDVIDELTLDGGRDMWTREKWDEFVPRLQKWMAIFEDTGTRNGLSTDKGFMLGTDEPCLADIVTAILWSTMADRFPVIASLLAETAPKISGLSSRMMELKALDALRTKAFEKYGQSYCGGEIEKSLRSVAT